MIVFLDIETLPCSDPDLIADLTINIKPPATMKKFDTIQKWEQEERPQAVADAIARTSLDGAYGRICVIGWAIDDHDPLAIVANDEREVIATFYREIEQTINPMDGHSHGPTWVGHNIIGFDLPFLRKRSVIHSILPPSQLLHAMSARPWTPGVEDTMLMWDADRDKRIGLDRLCKVLSIPSPKQDGIDGSKVAELFAAGSYERLGEYCCADIEATRRCWRAMKFQ